MAEKEVRFEEQGDPALPVELTEEEQKLREQQDKEAEEREPERVTVTVGNPNLPLDTITVKDPAGNEQPMERSYWTKHSERLEKEGWSTEEAQLQTSQDEDEKKSGSSKSSKSVGPKK